MRVAFQGEAGAYSEDAALRFCGPGATTLPFRDFGAVGRAVATSLADLAILPVENSIAGSVGGSYEVLLTHDLAVIGEVIVPIHHCLLAVPGTQLQNIERVLSHPVALAQCGNFFEQHQEMEAVAWYDTAGAARHVAEQHDRTLAAIAGHHAGRRYALDILAEHVEDRRDNQTRFLVVAQGARAHELAPVHVKAAARRTSLLIETENVAGALAHVLTIFADRSLNLSKLEARPGDTPWSYLFFIDIDADVDAPVMQESLSELRGLARVRVLGSYDRAGTG